MSSPAQDRLLKLIQDKYGADKHPILVMAELAFSESEESKIRLDAAKSIMPYIEAQRKAIEFKGDLGNNVGLLRVQMVNPEYADDDFQITEED